MILYRWKRKEFSWCRNKCFSASFIKLFIDLLLFQIGFKRSFYQVSSFIYLYFKTKSLYFEQFYLGWDCFWEVFVKCKVSNYMSNKHDLITRETEDNNIMAHWIWVMLSIWGAESTLWLNTEFLKFKVGCKLKQTYYLALWNILYLLQIISLCAMGFKVVRLKQKRQGRGWPWSKQPLQVVWISQLPRLQKYSEKQSLRGERIGSHIRKSLYNLTSVYFWILMWLTLLLIYQCLLFFVEQNVINECIYFTR